MQDVYEEAELYCAAFDFPVDQDVAWAIREAQDLTGRRPCSVIEPMCGNGRFGPVFAREGLRYHGFDQSPSMLARSEGNAGVTLSAADATSFLIEGAPYDLGWCPINSIRHIWDIDDFISHMRSMRNHLDPAGLYIVEVNFVDVDGEMDDTPVDWEVPQADGTVVKAWWWGERGDRATRRMWEGARFERHRDGAILQRVQSTYEMLMGSVEDFSKWIEAGGFRIERAMANRQQGPAMVEFGPALNNNGINHYLLLRPSG